MKNTIEHSRLGSDINEHLLTLYNVALEIKARTIIELGTRTGESMIPLLEAAHATKGRLYSVDVELCEEAKRKVKEFGLGERWTFVMSDDIEFGLKWPQTNPIDMVFVDTTHEYEQTKKEIAIFEPLIRPGGIMAFHDTESRKDGVLKPIQEFLKTHAGYEFYNYLNNNGLGVMRKPCPK